MSDQQPALPGWRTAQPLWPPAKTHHAIVPINQIAVSFGGSIELFAGVLPDHELARELTLGKTISMLVLGVVTATDGHKRTKDGVIGVATISLDRAQVFVDPEEERRLQYQLMAEAAAIHARECAG